MTKDISTASCTPGNQKNGHPSVKKSKCVWPSLLTCGYRFSASTSHGDKSILHFRNSGIGRMDDE